MCVSIPIHSLGCTPDRMTVVRVRASTLFFDQALDRFFSTLPLESGVEVR